MPLGEQGSPLRSVQANKGTQKKMGIQWDCHGVFLTNY
jgi:hypothetical protein